MFEKSKTLQNAGFSEGTLLRYEVKLKSNSAFLFDEIVPSRVIYAEKKK
jgi:hypothetical protein